MLNKLAYASPVVKDRIKRVELIKEALHISLIKNRCETTTDYKNPEMNSTLVFKKVKKESIGTKMRPHNYSWNLLSTLENEDIVKYHQIEVLNKKKEEAKRIESEIEKEVKALLKH